MSVNTSNVNIRVIQVSSHVTRSTQVALRVWLPPLAVSVGWGGAEGRCHEVLYNPGTNHSTSYGSGVAGRGEGDVSKGLYSNMSHSTVRL